jgi:glyceraldehyde 3-phosphate dehydrogenase
MPEGRFEMRVAVNGFGRIGRLVFRAALNDADIDIVAANDITDAKTLAHLLRYDSVHGKLPMDVTVDGDSIRCGDNRFRILSEMDPKNLPWQEMEVDLVLESTGRFTSRDKAAMHLKAGAKKVIVSAPCKEADATIALGVNQEIYDHARHHVVSNASCTTNCLAPVVKVLHDNWTIKRGWMTTIHAYTARAIGLVIPELKGKLDGIAMRVPVPDGSVVDLVAETEKNLTTDEMHAAMRSAAEGPLRGILEYSEEDLVSSDIVHNPHSSIYDSKMSAVMDGNLVKVLSWYDNEWGFSKRVIDLIHLIRKAG